MKTTDFWCVWLCGSTHVCESQRLTLNTSSILRQVSQLNPELTDSLHLHRFWGSALILAHQVLCPLSHLSSLQPWALGTPDSGDEPVLALVAAVLLKSALQT